MIRIGITGMSGSGKSYVCSIFHTFGIPSINADSVVHRLYSERNGCTEDLARIFGKGILQSDHSVDRKALASIVFSDPSMLDILNHTVHPYVIEEIDKLVQSAQENGYCAILIDAPQLFEAGMEQSCDYIIAVIADDTFKVGNIMRRDNITEEKAQERLSNQHSDSFFMDRSDYTLHNGVDADLQGQIIKILQDIGLPYERKE